ncbi:alpha/beta fold hydrolase [Agromyces bauzanensis]
MAAVLWPERVTGIVSVNGYLIQDIRASMHPLRPDLEAGFWYFFYFLTERGRAGLAANRREIAEVIWRRNSPEWAFDDAALDRAAAAFRNPDYVDVVIHSYRDRLNHVDGAPGYRHLEGRLAELPPIGVPAVTLDGLADGNFPATDAAASAAHFTGPRVHRHVPGVGHNLPQEAPDAFAAAVIEVTALAEGSEAVA